jgi:iron complex transport system substrate-binding protein
MRTLRIAVLSTLALGLAVTALAQTFPLTVTDDRGQEILIETAPQRIVAIGALYAQVLVDLGAVDRLVGLADSPENPPETEGIPSVGGSFAPSVELIVDLNPDLVLGATDWSGDRDALEDVGITVLTTPLMTGAGDVLDAIRTIGTAIGLRDAAAAQVGSLAEAIVRIESAAFGATPRRAAFLYMSEADTPPYDAGAGTIEGELLYRAGATNAFADAAGFPQVSLESVLERDPEVIFTSPVQVSFFLDSETLRGVSAVRNDRVFGVEAADATSTKIVELLQALVDALHTL